MKKIRWLILLLILFSFLGLFDAVFLLSQHGSNDAAVCKIGENTFGNCSAVLTSEYSIVLGVSVALIGTVYYFIALFFSAFLFSFYKRKILFSLTILTGIGFTISVWLVYLQLFVLNAICIYCMFSAIATTVLFITSLILLRFKISSSVDLEQLQ